MKYKRIRWLLALLVTALVSHAQTSMPLTDNGNGMWSLAAMPDYDVKLEVEYENDYSLMKDFTDNGNGTWSLAAMPDYDVKLEVEYETDYSLIKDFTDNGDGTWSLAAMPDYDVKLEVEYETDYSLIKDFTDNGDGTWTLASMPDCDMKLVVEYETDYSLILDLTDNGDGTWSLVSMPDYNVKLEVEYEDDLSLILDFVNNGDGKWTLDQMPDYNVKLVVEYMDDITDISLADNANNAAILNTYNGETVNVTLDGRTLYKDGKWNTLTLPFDVPSLMGTPLEGATIMEMNTAKKNGFDAASGTLYLAFETVTQIEAGKPYLVKWTSGADIVEPVFSDVTISSTTPTAIESATSGLETVKMVGNYAPVTVKADDQSVMFMGDDNSLYYTTEDRSLRNFRAHFEIPSQQSAPALARSFVIDFDGDEVVTGIDGIRIANDGQTDGWYSLDGRRLDRRPTQKGIYIHDGSKVIIK